MQSTHNQGRAYEHSLNHALEFFSKAGSLFVGRETAYGSEESALSLFQKTWITDKELSFKLLLWLRDCRGGAGNRSAFRACLTWLANHEPDWVNANIKSIPEVGRWDDLKSLYGTPCEQTALQMWAEAIKNAKNDSLACKWASRRDNKLRKQLGLEPKAYRKLLVAHTKVVESKMCARQWHEIEYKEVPSVAMARYTNAFGKHDGERLEKYKEAVASGDQTIHAATLFPHDCARTAQNGDKEIADLQFKALPNYLAETDKRIICLCDSSGSMEIRVSGSVQAIDISTSLSLYCSDRLPKESPFYRKFLQFEAETRLTDWSGMEFSEVMTGEKNIFNGAAGSTDVQKALETLLNFGTLFQAKPEQMPNVLLIVSDMQFDYGTADLNGTEIEYTLDRWVAAGYERPVIIYWNTAGYAGSPATVKSKDVALVSGFNSAILQAILSGDDISPKAIMLRALTKYKIEPAKS